MTATIVIGDGPAGLSAALFLAKNGHAVTVYGKDDTAMHYAELHNYLGVPQIGGTEFQERARAQVTDCGAVLVDESVVEVGRDGERFTVTTDAGTSAAADYVVIAGGKPSGSLAGELGVTVGAGGVDTDRNGATAVDRVYVVGRLARPDRSQAIISAGDGAAAAIDILSREAGESVHDWDTPPKDA